MGALDLRPALFPTFFGGGFEGSTHVDRSGRRQDFIQITQHDRAFAGDYQRVRALGIRVVREVVRWYLCDRGGRLDFSSIAPMVDLASQLGLVQINCLLHYGYPDDVDPFDPAFVDRFAAFAHAYAAWRRARVAGPRWYSMVNETSLFAYAAGDVAWFAPFLTGQGQQLKVALVKAGIAATRAVRAADPEAKFLSIDPLTVFAAPLHRPDLAEEAASRTRARYEAWDMALGRRLPELGGDESFVDAIGINCYPDTQIEIGGDQLALDDPRRVRFSEQLREVYARYQRPIVVAETSARRDERPVWLTYLVDEALAALAAGVDLQGIILYPLVDMPEWKGGTNGDWGHLGLWDIRREGDTLRRVPNEPYLKALRRGWQRIQESGLAPVASAPPSLPASVDLQTPPA